jgi:hypothetical protein
MGPAVSEAIVSKDEFAGFKETCGVRHETIDAALKKGDDKMDKLSTQLSDLRGYLRGIAALVGLAVIMGGVAAVVSAMKPQQPAPIVQVQLPREWATALAPAPQTSSVAASHQVALPATSTGTKP